MLQFRVPVTSIPILKEQMLFCRYLKTLHN
jgi:hypothetical protein